LLAFAGLCLREEQWLTRKTLHSLLREFTSSSLTQGGNDIEKAKIYNILGAALHLLETVNLNVMKERVGEPALAIYLERSTSSP
jgi:hypothetical protein